jgi:ligand-binding SRPBCC domain-containing protein
MFVSLLVVFAHRSIVSASAARLFQWHERPEALLDLVPLRRWVRIEHQVGGLRDGGRATIAVGAGPFRARWEARHFGFIQDEQFCDEQLSGPFAMWRHTHVFEAIGPNQTAYEDRVECVLPGGAFINWLSAPILRRMLTRMFEWRHKVVREAMARTP